jgi:CBS-domain-containing membrane protein
MTRQIREGRIRDIMTSPAPTLRPDTPIRDLKTLFALHDTRAFAIVDDRRRLRGIVTVFDLLRAFRSSSSRWFPDLRALWGERVEDIMRGGLWTLQADEPIAAAVDVMLNRSITTVPVVEGRGADARLIGMVDLRDVLSSLTFESPVSHDRHGYDERHARYGERAKGRHASSHHRDDPAHARASQAVRAS